MMHAHMKGSVSFFSWVNTRGVMITNNDKDTHTVLCLMQSDF